METKLILKCNLKSPATCRNMNTIHFCTITETLKIGRGVRTCAASDANYTMFAKYLNENHGTKIQEIKGRGCPYAEVKEWKFEEE